MENVLTAIIMLFIILFGAFTLATTFVNSQESMRDTWQQMDNRLMQQSRTHLSPVVSTVSDDGATVEFILRNDGQTRLADFHNWDAVVQYNDDALTDNYHVIYAVYIAANPAAGQWTVKGIYQDGNESVPEVFEPGILNPGEEVSLLVKVAPSVGSGKSIQATFTTPNGITVTATGIRLKPPVLVNNLGLTVTSGGNGQITSAMLSATDVDRPPEHVIYKVISVPSQGRLNLGDTFTQLAIDNGLLNYISTGTGTDAFTFVLTDGKNTVGPFIFKIKGSAPPVLANNTVLKTTGNTAQIITNSMLSATDADDPAGAIIFNVTVPPTLGTLSPSTAFTQSAIDAGQLTYTPTGSGADTFAFTITDGKTTVGPYTFHITNP